MATDLLPGCYTVNITDANGCTGFTVACISINTGIQALSQSTALSVYPNPANGIINLAINKSASVSYAANTSALQKLGTTPGITAAQTSANAVYDIKIINITK